MSRQWQLVQISDVADVVGGGTPSTSNSAYWSDEYVWLTPTEVAAVDGLSIGESKRMISGEGLANSSAKLLPPNTVLLTSRATVGFVALAEVSLCTNQGFQSLVCGDRVLPKFMMFWIQANRGEFTSRAAGSTFKEISPTNVRSVKLHLPPLDVQRRIVDVIEHVDAVIRTANDAMEKTRTARSAFVSDAMNPKEDWVHFPLGEICEANPESVKALSDAEEISYIDLSSVSQAEGIDSNLWSGRLSDAPGRAKRLVREGDVLVSTVRPYLKGFAKVKPSQDGFVASTGFTVLRAKTSMTVPNFVWAIISTDEFVSFLMSRATGSNYPAVRPSDILDYQIALPPIEMQIQLAEIVESFDLNLDRLSTVIQNAQLTRSAILADLLSGTHEIPDSYDRFLEAG